MGMYLIYSMEGGSLRVFFSSYNNVLMVVMFFGLEFVLNFIGRLFGWGR